MSPSSNSRPSPPLDWVVQRNAVDDVFARVEARLRRRRRRRMTAVGGAALALLLGIGLWQYPSATPLSGTLATAASSATVLRPETRTLPDGSTVELRDGAQVAVSFGPEVRRIELRGGEAYFSVAKDTARPFVVAADGVEVRAVGTAFSVQVQAGTVDVVVAEGRVAVSAPERGTGDIGAVALAAGQAASLGPSTRNSTVVVAAVAPAELNERLAWRVPRLDFSGTPLAEAILLFNRHGAAQLALADPRLGALELSGVMRADNIESLLRLLHAEFGITAERTASAIVLHPRR